MSDNPKSATDLEWHRWNDMFYDVRAQVVHAGASGALADLIGQMAVAISKLEDKP